MPSLDQINTNATKPDNVPEPREWKNLFVYPNDKKSIEAVFYDPDEYRMGAYGWKLNLIDTYSGQVLHHPILKETGIGHIRSYAPWSGSALLLTDPYGTGCRLYDVDKKLLSALPYSGAPVCVRGSSYASRYILMTEKYATLIRKNGEESAKLNILHPDREYPEFRWFESSNIFFSIHREKIICPPIISFYEGNAGKAFHTTIIDPDKLLPYDKTSYECISRIELSLTVNQQLTLQGHYLDMWSHVDFDEDLNILRLRIYRPTSPVYKRGHLACTCDVKEHWVSMRLQI